MSLTLESWVNPEYVELYRQGRLGRLRSSEPFTHAVLKDFLSPQGIASVLHHCEGHYLEPSHRQGIAAQADWYWGAFSHLEYIRFFLGFEMRDFMNQLVGDRLILKRGGIPQFNTFRPGSKGIPVHTDMNEKVGVVTLLQLSQGYQPGRGGELVFYKRSGEKIHPVKYVQPVCNTLILFKVSERSYHSVEDMNGEWTRRTITYDFLSEAQAHAALVK
jgi:hypothetical protein